MPHTMRPAKCPRGTRLPPFIHQYRDAIQNYLRAATRDTDAADELYQDFALRFVRGDFQRADPSRGRFRDLIKTALSNLIRDYHKRKHVRTRGRVSLGEAMAQAEEALDKKFRSDWLSSLIGRVEAKLSEVQNPDGAPYFQVFLLIFANPELSAAQLAERLTAQMKPAKPFNAAQVRKLVQRTRERVSDLLVDEVCQSLQVKSIANAALELQELGLLEYCRPTLIRRPTL